MDFGNTCALVCRLILLILLLYGLILSCLVISSCHFVTAVTHPADDGAEGEDHGVGLQTFENQDGECVPHNSFVIKNYNGTEMAAKVGGYVAASCAAASVLWLLFECCKRDGHGGGCFGGKCIPMLLLTASVICQSLTFLLFESDLFCANKDIASCAWGDSAYRSLQAAAVYAFGIVLYWCGPTPVPFSPPAPKVRAAPAAAVAAKQPSAAPGTANKRGRREKEGAAKPPKGGDYARELHEERRRSGKNKGKGASGRKKEKIPFDLQTGTEREEKTKPPKDRKDDYGKSYENSIVSYEPDRYNNNKRGKKGTKSPGKSVGDHAHGVSDSIHGRMKELEPKYDEYVDTDPDGMDWSAYTPVQREAYYERQRGKKRERKERERERTREREQLVERDHHYDHRDKDYDRDARRHSSGQSPRESPRESDYDYNTAKSSKRGNSSPKRIEDDDYTQDTRGDGGYDDSYRSRTGGGYDDNDDSYRYNESYYSDARSGYDTAQHYRDDDKGGGRVEKYKDGDRGGDRGYDDDYHSTSPGTRDSRDYDRSDYDQSQRTDDYSYSQADDYSYAQSYNDNRSRRDPDGGRHNKDSGGRGSSDTYNNNDSYYDNESYGDSATYDDYSRRGGGHRDDPSLV